MVVVLSRKVIDYAETDDSRFDDGGSGGSGDNDGPNC